MKKAILIFLLWGVFSSVVFAGTTGKLAGFVKEKTTGNPLAGVNIILEGTYMGAASDLEGQYFIVNIPVGTYTVKVTMIGYQIQTVKNVVIAADLTTKIDFNLAEEAVKGEEVTIVAERPAVQKDLTATINVIDALQVRELPVTSYRQIVDLQTGVVVVPIRMDQAGPYGLLNTTPDDGFHFRGGRTNETAYLFNGISIKDPIWGSFFIEDLPILGINQLVTYTGTYMAEYGEGMSAVMNMVSLPGNTKPQFSYTAYTDKLDFINIEDINTYNNEIVYRGPIPGLKNKVTANFAARYYTTDGRFYGYIYPNYRDTEGSDKSGTAKKVPMNYDDSWSAIGSFGLAVSKNIKLTVGGLFNDKETKMYHHLFKYNPYGQPKTESDYWLGYAQFKQVLSEKYFYEFSYSRYTRNFKSSTFDDLETCLVEQHILSPENFEVSGIDYVWIKTLSETDEFKFTFLGQVTPIHQLKTGFGFLRHNLDYQRRNPSAQDADTTQLRMKAWEAYTRKPNALYAYLQDKIEFHKIGMILNVGLRYDRIYPKTYKMQDQLRPTSSDMEWADYVDYFSPRLGVSYPISDKMAFRFAYGIYYQYPHFYLAYQGTNDEESVYPNYSLAEVTQIGDGGINPERTTSYEAGLQFALNPSSSLNLTAFYRDISDLTGLKTIYGPRTYQLFTNDAYGIARGVEVALRSQFSQNFRIALNYTFSHVSASKQSIWYVPLYPQNRTFIADWDIPHKFSFDMEYVHSSLFGIAVIGSLNSGYPYSPSALNPNSERGPSQKNLDVNLYKRFELFGFQQTFFVHITNVFNEQNVWWVYADTGQPGVDANEATSDDYTKDPTAWGPPRHIRVGLTINY